MNRRVVLNALRATNSHPTAQDLFLLIGKKQPYIALTTLYRCIDWLVEQKLARLVYRDKEGAAHFDANMDPHDHVICLECGTIVDVVAPRSPHLYSQVYENPHFQVDGHTTIFLGVCPSCQAT